MPKRFAIIAVATQKAFRQRGPVAAAVIAAVAVIFLAMLLPNLALFGFILAEDGFDAPLKLKSVVMTFWAGRAIFTKATGLIAVPIALLFGWNVGLLYHYLKRKLKADRVAGTSAVGVVLGLMGVGCASCGSVFLTTLLGAGAATAVIGVLPWKGLEFGIIGMLVIAASISHVSQKIADPDACGIPHKR